MKRVFRILLVLVLCLLFAGCEFGGGGSSTNNVFKGISFRSESYEYDGTAKSLFINNLPEGATVEYVGNEHTEPGKYTVKAIVTIGEETKEFSATLTITEPDPFVGATLSDLKVTYDGNPHSIVVENLPAGVTVSYNNNEKVDAGGYNVTATLQAKGLTKTLTARLTIEKATPEFTVPDGQNMYLSATGETVGEYTLNNNEQTVSYVFVGGFAGEGEYDVHFVANESKNYLSADVLVHVNFYLNEYGIAFAESKFVYDGTEKVATLSNVPAGATVEYTNNAQTEQGRYNVSARVLNGEDLLCVVNTIMVIDNPKNMEFEQFLDEFLVAMFEEDQMSINFFFVHPENFGLDHYDAEFPIANLEYDAVERESEFQELFGELHQFLNARLSFEEQIAYEIVDNYLNYLYQITEDMEYMNNGYLGSYLGYQANIPLDLAEYKFRNEQDIQDFIDLLNSSVEAFHSYYDYTVEQFNRGYGLTDKAIDSVVSQCEKFVAERENHYLIDIFNDKIDNIDFELTLKSKEQYKAEAKAGIQDQLCSAYQYIQENLPALKGSEVSVGGLCTYGEDGLEYYRLKLGNTVGMPDINIEDTIDLIDDALREYSYIVDTIVQAYRNMSSGDQNIFYKAIDKGTPAYSRQTPDQLLEMYQELAKQFVPDIDEMPEITIKLVYDSLKDNFSPAAYFVSPLDETRYESIYLNPKYTTDYNYIFTTLAHEGYPGHLYQNVYAKSLDIPTIRKALRCQGYMEGWATYMEINSYSWVTNYTSYPLQCALEYNKYNDILNGLLSCRVDLGIHAQGWLPEDIARYLTRLLGNTYTAEDMQSFYDQVVEIPTNMSMYFLSWLTLHDLHEKAVEELGAFFNEVAFNKVILDCGAAPLYIVSEKCNQYIEEAKFIYNIA